MKGKRRAPHAPARWGMLVTTAVMGLALVGTSLAGYLSAREAAGDLVKARSIDLTQSVRRALAWSGPDVAEALSEAYGDLEESGVRFLALIDRRGNFKARAGESSASDTELKRLARGGPMGAAKPLRDGERARTVVALKGPRFGPRGRRGPRAMRAARRNLPRGILIIEAEPLEADALTGRALRALLVGSAAALLLLAAALFFWRQSTRAAKLERELARSEHLASLGEMSAVLGHELKNPLTSLKGHAQLTLEHLEEGEPARRGVEQVVREAVRLEHLMKQILDFAKSDGVEPTRVDPVVVAHAAIDEVTDEGGDVEVALDHAGAPDSWPLDDARVRQVLVNVIRNAVQASPAGDEVRVAVGRERGQLVYTISDRGPGIPPDERARIFEPFVTGKTRGTGLGLAVSRRIVERHGGRIEVQDNPGGGARMRLVLPDGAGRGG